MIVNILFHEESDKELIESMGGTIISELSSLKGFMIADVSNKLFSYLKSHPSIKYINKDVESNIDIVPEYTNNTPITDSSYTDNFKLMRVAEYWERGITGKGVKIAVLDTGLLRHYSITPSGGYNTIDDNLEYFGDAVGGTNQSHGTNVASVIVGSPRKFDANGIGGGIAIGAELYVLKFNHSSNSFVSQWLRAFDWMLKNDIDLLNFSYSSNGESDPILKEGWESILNSKIIVFIPSGNSSTDDNSYPQFPKRDPRVVAVGGLMKNTSTKLYTRWNDTDGYGSNYGYYLSFSAPAKNILVHGGQGSTTAWGGASFNQRGTSIATPAICAIFALYKQVYPNKTNQELISTVIDSCMQFENYNGWNQFYGHGLPQPNEHILSLPKVKETKKSLKFGGYGQYIEVGDNSAFNLQNNLTLSVDFKQKIGTSGRLIGKTSNNGSLVYYGVDSTSSQLTFYYVDGTTQRTAVFERSLSDGRRHTLTVVYNFPNLQVYIDGSLIPKTLTFTTMANNASAILTLGNSFNNAETFNGYIYGARVYSRSLSGQEVKDDYNNKYNSSGLILNYSPEGDEDGILDDKSGRGFNGILHGVTPATRVTNPRANNTKVVEPNINLSATSTDYSVTLNWTASPNSVAYHIYRDNETRLLANVTTNRYVDDTVSSSKTYNYSVYAIDSVGGRSKNSITISTKIDITPPVAVSSLVATPYEDSCLLEWNHAEQNVKNLGKFEIYQGNSSSTFATSTLISTVTRESYYDVPYFYVAQLTPSTSYKFWIVAIDEAGNRSPEALLEVTTIADTRTITHNDDFNRTATTLGSMNTGGAWTLFDSAYGFGTNGTRAYDLKDNYNGFSTASTTITNSNYSVEAEIYPASNAYFCGIIVRGIGDGSFISLAYFNEQIVLSHYQDWDIYDYGMIPSNKTNYKLRIDVKSDHSILAYVDDVFIGGFKDSSYSLPHSVVGIIGDTLGNQYDNFKIRAK